jgi:hypothetical protein
MMMSSIWMFIYCVDPDADGLQPKERQKQMGSKRKP